MAKPNRVTQDYPHLQFRRCWKLSAATLTNLGRCESMVECISDLPIEPSVQDKLRSVSLERSAIATTAIEGNTLSLDELRKRLEGLPLPKSREYQATEVTNVLGLMNQVADRVLEGGSRDRISTKMLCDFNREIGKNLGALYDGAPGKLRRDLRHVGAYLAPPPEHVEGLLNEFCEWLLQEFHYHVGKQSLAEAIVQAIVAHVFFEWIHPFADGNGRTGRMLEFYILLRAGMPDVTSHVLANHYNASRNEYASHFESARKRRDLTAFLDYAIQGLADGLRKSWTEIGVSTFRVCWEAYVYKTFGAYTNYNKRSIFKRRRDLALAMPIDREFTLLELTRQSDRLAATYFGKDSRAIRSDMAVLLELGLVEKIDNGESYRSTAEKLRTRQRIRRAT